ncbi:hypothetical protein I204_04339 [Kwoniella mangroviensis CBS 8886]|uniref:uncharacterized protein n=1 Tax=Kwoniella mangroviensis CBS 8507 TaxID=1296122 RepID=UPI00080D2278|nr:uncharacterized protein I203_03043 [Kwoniella mangroviensis CBS 8507]OCF67349.1 hypothetical protein I203_03043 [Kwoniella mangroviensis CBS 8507]OCF75483.1 hypothetical protein I204_04339 [Kwoniella mangroviensis CBS 8886]
MIDSPQISSAGQSQSSGWHQPNIPIDLPNINRIVPFPGIIVEDIPISSSTSLSCIDATSDPDCPMTKSKLDMWSTYAREVFSQDHNPLEKGLPCAAWFKSGYSERKKGHLTFQLPKPIPRTEEMLDTQVCSVSTAPPQLPPSIIPSFAPVSTPSQGFNHRPTHTRVTGDRVIDTNGMLMWLSNYHESVVNQMSKEYTNILIRKTVGTGNDEKLQKLLSLVAARICETYKTDLDMLTIRHLDEDPKMILDQLIEGTRALLEEASNDSRWLIAKVKGKRIRQWNVESSKFKGGNSSRTGKSRKRKIIETQF